MKRIKAQGVQRRLVGVELDGEPFPALNNVKWPARKTSGGEPIGKVTSAIYSPRLKKNIGYCWVPADLAKDGTKVQVDERVGPADRDGRADAVRGPGQADPGVLIRRHGATG